MPASPECSFPKNSAIPANRNERQDRAKNSHTASLSSHRTSVIRAERLQPSRRNTRVPARLDQNIRARREVEKHFLRRSRVPRAQHDRGKFASACTTPRGGRRRPDAVDATRSPTAPSKALSSAWTRSLPGCPRAISARRLMTGKSLQHKGSAWHALLGRATLKNSDEIPCTDECSSSYKNLYKSEPKSAVRLSVLLGEAPGRFYRGEAVSFEWY